MALAEMSSAFSWNPNGVSSITAGPGPTRASRSRWTLLIVGLVSPDPMMTSSRAIEATLGKGRVQQVRQLDRELDVQVVVTGREPLHLHVRRRGSQFAGDGALLARPVVGGVGHHQ